MPEYGTCECSRCYVRVPKPEAYRVTVEREKGRSSGSYRFSSRSTSYYTGRTYYAKQDMWLCADCYRAYHRKQTINSATAILAVLARGGAFIAFASNSGDSRRSLSPTTLTLAGEPTNQTASLVRAEEVKTQPVVSPKDLRTTQNRLIELGYLVGPADGVWGPRSRDALIAFKISNSLPADDKWDTLVNTRLLSANVVRGPLSIATGPSASKRDAIR
jgi:hypothetical protein